MNIDTKNKNTGGLILQYFIVFVLLTSRIFNSNTILTDAYAFVIILLTSLGQGVSPSCIIK